MITTGGRGNNEIANTMSIPTLQMRRLLSAFRLIPIAGRSYPISLTYNQIIYKAELFIHEDEQARTIIQLQYPNDPKLSTALGFVFGMVVSDFSVDLVSAQQQLPFDTVRFNFTQMGTLADITCTELSQYVERRQREEAECLAEEQRKREESERLAEEQRQREEAERLVNEQASVKENAYLERTFYRVKQAKHSGQNNVSSPLLAHPTGEIYQYGMVCNELVPTQNLLSGIFHASEMTFEAEVFEKTMEWLNRARREYDENAYANMKEKQKEKAQQLIDRKTGIIQINETAIKASVLSTEEQINKRENRRKERDAKREAAALRAEIKKQRATEIREQEKRTRQEAWIAAEQKKCEEAESLAEEQRQREEAERIAEEQLLREEAERIAEEHLLREEAERVAEEQRLREEAERIAEEQRLREEAERIAEEQRLREEAERVAEEQRLREEAERIAEEQRLREEAERVAEEQRQREEIERLAEEQRQRNEGERLAEEQRQREEAERLAEEQHQRNEAVSSHIIVINDKQYYVLPLYMFNNFHNTVPFRLEIEGTFYGVATWSDLPVVICSYLFTKYSARMNPLVDNWRISGTNRVFITSSENKSHNRRSLITKQYIDLGYSIEKLVETSFLLCEFCGLTIKKIILYYSINESVKETITDDSILIQTKDDLSSVSETEVPLINAELQRNNASVNRYRREEAERLTKEPRQQEENGQGDSGAQASLEDRLREALKKESARNKYGATLYYLRRMSDCVSESAATQILKNAKWARYQYGRYYYVDENPRIDVEKQYSTPLHEEEMDPETEELQKDTRTLATSMKDNHEVNEINALLHDICFVPLREELEHQRITTIAALRDIKLWAFMNRFNLYSIANRQLIFEKMQALLEPEESLTDEKTYSLHVDHAVYKGTTPSEAYLHFCEDLARRFPLQFRTLVGVRTNGGAEIPIHRNGYEGRFFSKIPGLNAYISTDLSSSTVCAYTRWLAIKCGEEGAAIFIDDPIQPSQEKEVAFTPTTALRTAETSAEAVSFSYPVRTDTPPAVSEKGSDLLISRLEQYVLKADMDGVTCDDAKEALGYTIAYTQYLVSKAKHIVDLKGKLIHENAFIDWEEGASQLETILDKLMQKNHGYVSSGQLFEYVRSEMNMFLNDNNINEEQAVHDIARHLFEKTHYHDKQLYFHGNVHISRPSNKINTILDVVKTYATEQGGFFELSSLVEYLDSVGVSSTNLRLQMRLQSEPMFLYYEDGVLVYAVVLHIDAAWEEAIAKSLQTLFNDVGDHIILRSIPDLWFARLPTLPGGRSWTPLLLQSVLRFYTKPLGAYTIKAMNGQTMDTVHTMLVRNDSPIRNFGDVVIAYLLDNGIEQRVFEAEALRRDLVNAGMIKGNELIWNMPKALGGDERYAWDAEGSCVTIKVR